MIRIASLKVMSQNDVPEVGLHRLGGVLVDADAVEPEVDRPLPALGKGAEGLDHVEEAVLPGVRDKDGGWAP